MSETKPPFRSPLYHGDSLRQRGIARPAANKLPERGRDQQGWDAYRKWLSSVGGKTKTERAPFDPSIYSWKGYNNWADKVKQSWKPEK
jgi:hypothetical protein